VEKVEKMEKMKKVEKIEKIQSELSKKQKKWKNMEKFIECKKDGARKKKVNYVRNVEKKKIYESIKNVKINELKKRKK
jgi:hypothetical protein